MILERKIVTLLARRTQGRAAKDLSGSSATYNLEICDLGLPADGRNQ
jgi:hypothetical protein